jgi:hypothetical protein
LNLISVSKMCKALGCIISFNGSTCMIVKGVTKDDWFS